MVLQALQDGLTKLLKFTEGSDYFFSRKKVIKLQAEKEEQSAAMEAATSMDESMNVSMMIRTSKPMEELQKQLDSERTKIAKLKENFFKVCCIFDV